MGKSTASVLRTFAIVQSILCGAIRGAQSQEPPTLIASQNDTGVSFRQDVCTQHALFDRGEVDLRDALNGVELHPAFGDWGSDFFHLDPNTGGIDENDPGLFVILVEKLAQRAGFTWRDSYGTYSVPLEGQTWTDVGDWASQTFDFVADFWIYSTERLNKGMIFLPGWYDASFIMVGEETVETSTDIFSWLAPFDYRVWIMSVLTVIFSGVIYWAMGRLDRSSSSTSSSHFHDMRNSKINNPTKGSRSPGFTNPTGNFYMSALAVTGHFEFHPDRFDSMLLTFSLAFWSLLLLVAYTANLASFFVVKNIPTLGVKTIDDAVLQQLPICLWKGTSSDLYVTKRFPAYKSFIRIVDENELIMSAVGPNKRCQIAVTSVSSWAAFEKQRDINVDCKLSWIGRVIKFVPGSFLTRADSGALCSSLIRDVLSLHLEEMIQSGEVEEIWDEYIRRTADQDCASFTVTSTTSKYNGIDQLGPKGLGGVFLTHYVLATVAILVSVFTNWRQRKMAARKRLREHCEEEMLKSIENEALTEGLEPSSRGGLQSSKTFVSKRGEEFANESREVAQVESRKKSAKTAAWQDSWHENAEEEEGQKTDSQPNDGESNEVAPVENRKKSAKTVAEQDPWHENS